MSEMNRRQMLQTAGLAAAGLVFAGQASAAETGEFELPKLPYAYDALEPHIDAETMHLHHDFHHKAYVDNLNKALRDIPSCSKRGSRRCSAISISFPRAFARPSRTTAAAMPITPCFGRS